MEKITQDMVTSQLDKIKVELEEHFGRKAELKVLPFSDREKAVVMMLEMQFPWLKQAFSTEVADVVMCSTVNGSIPTVDLDRLVELDLYMVSINHHVDFSYPWEPEKQVDQRIKAIQPLIYNLLGHVSDNKDREGLRDTPKRVAKAWLEWTSGYGQDIASIVKAFEDGAEGCDEMVIVKDIPIYSKCEHHLADIFGTATIAYIPNGKVAGLSKLSRLANVFARRLQVQERLTNQIADAMVEHMGALGVGVIIRARHMCMESRGICQQGHHTITSALRGVLKDNPETRAEFMTLANSSHKV